MFGHGLDIQVATVQTLIPNDKSARHQPSFHGYFGLIFELFKEVEMRCPSLLMSVRWSDNEVQLRLTGVFERIGHEQNGKIVHFAKYAYLCIQA